jgi:hypothetical protein
VGPGLLQIHVVRREMGCKMHVVEGSRAGVPNSRGGPQTLSCGDELRRVPVENKLSILRCEADSASHPRDIVLFDFSTFF